MPFGVPASLPPPGDRAAREVRVGEEAVAGALAEAQAGAVAGFWARYPSL